MNIKKSTILLFTHGKIISDRLPYYNVYNPNIILQSKNMSIEHIIPKRLFNNKKHAHDILNLVSCDKYCNSFRSDYRYGDIASEDMICIEYGCISRTHRIFMPSRMADYGLLSRSIISMLHKYPYLYTKLDQIVQYPYLLDKWSNYPISEYENKRNELYIIINQDKL